jgi:hypothetical protein
MSTTSWPAPTRARATTSAPRTLLQIVGAEADDLDEAMARFFAGLHLAAREPFATIAEAYMAARRDLERRRYHRPVRDEVGPATFRCETTLLGRRIDRDGVPALEALMQSPTVPGLTWIIRTGPGHVRAIDRQLRLLGVNSATLLGAQLWVELGLPLPATR